jgi:hypothetical protein
MKKLIQYLKQIDPRITVSINIVDDVFIVEAGIEDTFTCTVRNRDFRKAKKQFFRGPVTLALALEVADLHAKEAAKEAAEKERRSRRIREQEELLAKEFELMLEEAAEVDELQALLEYVEKHNEIRSKVDHMRGLEINNTHIERYDLILEDAAIKSGLYDVHERIRRKVEQTGSI